VSWSDTGDVISYSKSKDVDFLRKVTSNIQDRLTILASESEKLIGEGNVEKAQEKSKEFLDILPYMLEGIQREESKTLIDTIIAASVPEVEKEVLPQLKEVVEEKVDYSVNEELKAQFAKEMFKKADEKAGINEAKVEVKDVVESLSSVPLHQGTCDFMDLNIVQDIAERYQLSQEDYDSLVDYGQSVLDKKIKELYYKEADFIGPGVSRKDRKKILEDKEKEWLIAQREGVPREMFDRYWDTEYYIGRPIPKVLQKFMDVLEKADQEIIDKGGQK
jgi:hypothetical protein